MMIKFMRFNIYLLLAAGLVLLGVACQSSGKKKKKIMTALELHLEVNKDGAADNETISIFRDNPIYINVDKEFFLDSADIIESTVVEDAGGFRIRLKFNDRGSMILTGVTQANLGRRIGIFCSFGQARWLAAPMIRKQIADGVLTFTPDTTRAEADLIVKGLNDAAAELAKKEKL